MAHAEQSSSATSMIKSRSVLYTRPGGAEAVEIGDREVRAAGEGEIRIKVTAAAVNPTDILLRDHGTTAEGYPATPGMDAAGTVESIGPGVEGFTVGEEVMAIVNPRRPEGGAQSAYIVVPSASISAIPKGANLLEAATLPMNAVTGLLALEIASLKPGNVLAVTGGAGHLANFTIAAAKKQGLKIVADAKLAEHDLVRCYGADIVVERSDDFAGAVRRKVPEGVDALIDTALLADASFPAIKDGGTYIPVRGWAGDPAPRNIKIKPVMVPEAIERTDFLLEAKALVEGGAIKLKIAGEYPPERVGDAHSALLAGGMRGRPIIVF